MNCDGKWRGRPVGELAILMVALLGCRKDPEPPAAVVVVARAPQAASRSELELPQVRVAKGEFVDARDGQTYPFVRFDSLFERTDSGLEPYSQVWMARNLNYGGEDAQGQQANPRAWCAERGGESCCSVGGPSESGRKLCEQGNGLVYRWTAAMALDDSVVTDSGPRSLRYDSSYSYMGLIQPLHQGVCPEGWRLPTKKDWEALLANLERNQRFVPATFHPEVYEPDCEGEGCGEDMPDPPPEVLSYLKARSKDLPEWGKESDAQDPYGFGLLPRYSFWTTTRDTLERDDNFPNAPRVALFADPTGWYWGWQARFKYWNVPQSLKEGNHVRCIQWKSQEGQWLPLPPSLRRFGEGATAKGG